VGGGLAGVLPVCMIRVRVCPVDTGSMMRIKAKKANAIIVMSFLRLIFDSI
jgi:hypothetical protein